MKLRMGIVVGLLLLAQGRFEAQTAATRAPRNHGPVQTKATNTGQQREGQQVFERNCSRCHDAPQGFSTRITGTIAMHMRVRASLSEAEYKALVEFLNP